MNRKFDCVLQFDPRSANYPVRTLWWPWSRPRTRNWECYAHLDQKSEGACAGFAVAHDAAATPVVVLGVSNQTGLEIYHRAQSLDGIPGKHDGTTITAAMKAGKDAGFWKGYRWAFSERDIRLTVSHVGPVVLGVNWYTGMLDVDGDGFIHPTGQIEGGHAILMTGWDNKVERYRLHNSWGPRWGVDGDCFITAGDLTTLLNQRGEAAVPVQRRIPA